MYVLYAYDLESLDVVGTEYEWRTLDAHVLEEITQFLFHQCQYRIVHDQAQFSMVGDEYIPIIVANYDDNDNDNDDKTLISVCECMYSPVRSMIEIYNVCVHTGYRCRGYASDLIHIFEFLKTKFGCSLWIAVSRINPMFGDVIRLYKNMGFEETGIRFYTPSGIYYPHGFVELIF